MKKKKQINVSFIFHKETNIRFTLSSIQVIDWQLLIQLTRKKLVKKAKLWKGINKHFSLKMILSPRKSRKRQIELKEFLLKGNTTVVCEGWWRWRGRKGGLVGVQWWMQASTCNRVVHHAGWRTQMHPVHVHPLLPSCTQNSLPLFLSLACCWECKREFLRWKSHSSTWVWTFALVREFGPARHSLTMNRSPAGLRISRSQSF